MCAASLEAVLRTSDGPAEEELEEPGGAFLSREHAIPRKSPRKGQGRWPLASQEVGLSRN